MKKAANFYLQKLAWDADRNASQFHGSVYEDGGGHGPALNPQSDRNCIEALFKSCIRAARILDRDADMIPKWQTCAGPPVGTPAGQEKRIRRRGHRRLRRAAENIPSRAWAVGGAIAFPAGLIGIDDEGHAPWQGGHELIRALKGSMYSHHPMPVIAAAWAMATRRCNCSRTASRKCSTFPRDCCSTAAAIRPTLQPEVAGEPPGRSGRPQSSGATSSSAAWRRSASAARPCRK